MKQDFSGIKIIFMVIDGVFNDGQTVMSGGNYVIKNRKLLLSDL